MATHADEPGQLEPDHTQHLPYFAQTLSVVEAENFSVASSGGGMVGSAFAASLAGSTALSRGCTYSATKAAVINLTQNLAREWAAVGIRVNALSPGFFPAEQNRKVLTEERVASIMGHTPIDRFGEPHELAGAILLLASPRAGSFLTGENVVVDGGFMATTI